MTDLPDAVVCICGAKAAVYPDNSYGSCVVSCSADCEESPLYCLGIADLKVAIFQWNNRIPELRELKRAKEATRLATLGLQERDIYIAKRLREERSLLEEAIAKNQQLQERITTLETICADNSDNHLLVRDMLREYTGERSIDKLAQAANNIMALSAARAGLKVNLDRDDLEFWPASAQKVLNKIKEE